MYEYYRLELGNKLAFYGDEEQSQGWDIPWGKLALTGLLAGGGAYAHGRMAQNSPLQGFSQGVDDKVINPLMDKWRGFTTSPEQEYQGMQERVNNSAFIGGFKDLKSSSQLQGTDYYQPGKYEQAADTAAGVAGVGMLGGLAGKLRPLSRVPILGGALRGLGRLSGPLGAISTIPDGMQLGDKLNDTMGIQNQLGRNVVKGTTTAGAMAGTFGGARAGALLGARFGPVGAAVGGFGGGVLGTFAPQVINGTWNYANRRGMQNNQYAARASALGNEFTNALKSKQNGNGNPMQAWYAMNNTPELLGTTVRQLQGNPDLQKQIMLNNPNRPQ